MTSTNSRIHTACVRSTAVLCYVVAALFTMASVASATFSICAVDPTTGEVGSAGASCIAGSIILSDVHPGVGVVHTQSFWNAANQNYARQLMNQGFSPQEIIDMVVANDSQNNPAVRQYGVVDLVDGGRSAAFTGVNCFDWKGDTPGPTYSVQGNILLGPEIIDDMETAFLNTTGSLADKLMAALQAAKVPQADTRCNSKSSISAFLRVAQPGDSDNDLFLDLNVNNTAAGTDPIDVLQGLYDEWQMSATVPIDPTVDSEPEQTHFGHDGDNPFQLQMDPNPVRLGEAAQIGFALARPSLVSIDVFDAAGRQVSRVTAREFDAGNHEFEWSVTEDVARESGVFFLRMTGQDEGSMRVATHRIVVLSR